ncbi:helix-turn-helix transcriptional regulator [Novosphingobium sp. RL4]|uniref:helix-turn-helix domain-containing protein n=1 Tax=Novosphingobium sp. RL4 TaxID=3109595 RepID=UPI002D774CC9|nr:helix-turn-helix transcriptional regulator [Novosphingobium sp. RL4]WRT91887.1 helix-turn-helix transcriptional regulator [Novosphingobium sp. RL4]
MIAVRSFRRQTDNRRSIYLNLVGSIEGQIRQAYAKRHDADGTTQKDLADKLGVGKSVINRRLNGQSNMTVETLADMAWGLGHCVSVNIFDPTESPTNSFHIIPQDIGHVVAEPAKVKSKQFCTTIVGSSDQWTSYMTSGEELDL